MAKKEKDKAKVKADKKQKNNVETAANLTTKSEPKDFKDTAKQSANGDKSSELTLPDGWIQAGSNPREYDMGLCFTEAHSGDRCGSLQSNTQKLHGFGTLMQMFRVGEFKDKRVRLNGWVKSKNVDGWAGMWMRVDGERGQRGDSLAFDNMQDRPILRDTDWTKYEIVLEVSDRSVNIAFGVLLSGGGCVWMDDFAFEVVDDSVPLTGNNHKKRDYPHNLDFSQDENN